MSDKHDSSIQIVPPIRGTKEAPNPQWVDLTLKVELPPGQETDMLSDGDRVQYPISSAVDTIGDELNRMAAHEIQHWPPDILVVAASALLTANTALKQWLREDYAECLVTCEVAKREAAEFLKILES